MIERFRTWVRDRPLPADVLLAVAAVTVEGMLTTLLPRESWPDDLPRAVVASVLGAVPIALRRVALWVAVGIATVFFLTASVVGLYPYTYALATVILTYSAATSCRIRPAVVIATILWLPVIVASVAFPPPDGAQSVSPVFLVLNNLLVAMVSFFVGRTVHGKRVSTEALRERARVAEENLRTLAEQAVADERRRIARELHDVVAHHIVVIGVLATGARRMLRRDPDAADEALGTIEDTSRTTVREMRRLLDVLRTDTEPEAAEFTPQPGLAGIEALVEQVREAGLPVTLQVEADPRDFDPGVALTVFRIVQEALTNAIKHAGEATAQVRIGLDRRCLVIEILDTGRGPTPAGRVGHGLVGMRERVALYGGTLHTGPRPGGGFRVHARLPVENLGAPGGEEET